MFKKEDSVKDYLEEQKQKIDELFALCEDPDRDSAEEDKKSLKSGSEIRKSD